MIESQGMAMDHKYRRRPVDVTLPSYGVFVLESHHASGFRMTSQRHDFLEIFYVLEGSGVFCINGQPHSCRKGDVVVVPVVLNHRLQADPPKPLHLYRISLTPR